MKKIILDNKLYINIVALLVIAATYVVWQIDQGDAIMYLNARRTEFWDTFFSYGTQLGEELMYALIAFILLFKSYKKAFFIGATGVMVLIVSTSLKLLFAHDRPSVFFKKLGIFDQVNPLESIHLLVGSNSFPSGHTMGGFALFGVVALLMTNKKWFSLLCLAAAIVVGLSRVYLVQHFLKDITFGAFLGTYLAIFMTYLYTRTPTDPNKWYNKGILDGFDDAKEVASLDN